MNYFPILLVAVLGANIEVSDGENLNGFAAREDCLTRLEELNKLVPLWIDMQVGLPLGTAQVVEASCRTAPPPEAGAPA